MNVDDGYCGHLNSIPHTNPENAIWGFIVPWLLIVCCACAVVASASDEAISAHVKVQAESEPSIDNNAVPNEEDPRADNAAHSESGATADTEAPTPDPPTPASKASAFAITTVFFALASLAFTNQILGLLELDHCLPPAAHEHWWFNYGAGDPWSELFFVPFLSVFVAFFAWLKTFVNVVFARRGVYFDDGRWHHWLGWYILVGASVAPLVLIALILYGLAMLLVGTERGVMRRRCGKVVGFVDKAIRRPEELAKRGNAGGVVDEEALGEESPLLGERGREGEEAAPAYERAVENPPAYTAR